MLMLNFYSTMASKELFIQNAECRNKATAHS